MVKLPVDLPSTSYLFHSTVLAPPQQTSCCFYSYNIIVRHTERRELTPVVPLERSSS